LDGGPGHDDFGAEAADGVEGLGGTVDEREPHHPLGHHRDDEGVAGVRAGIRIGRWGWD